MAVPYCRKLLTFHNHNLPQ